MENLPIKGEPLNPSQGGWNLFQCKICCSILETKTKCWAHLWTKHGEIPISQSNVPNENDCWKVVTNIRKPCDLQIVLQNLVKKEEIESFEEEICPENSPKSKRRFQCQTCGKDYKYRYGLRRHQRNVGHLPVGEEQTVRQNGFFDVIFEGKDATEEWECETCKEVFQKRRELLNHKLRAGHLSNSELETQSDYICNYPGCGQMWRTPKTMEIHKCKAHDEHYQNLTDTKEKKTYLFSKLKAIGCRLEKCPFCGFEVLFKHKLVMHLATHDTAGYPCDKCGAVYTRESTLKKHMNRISCHVRQKDNEARKFTCDICGTKVKTLKQLRIHQKRLHGSVFPPRKKGDNTCKECGYKAPSSSILKKHLRTHTGEKPYQCSACGLCFSVLGNMWAHMRRCSDAKSRGIEPPKFSNNKNGVDYIFVGKGQYKCAYCPKIFPKRTIVAYHVKSHGNLFKCHDCSSNFLKLDAFTFHQRDVHSVPAQELGLPCHICGRLLKQQKNFERHYLFHHEIEAPKIEEWLNIVNNPDKPFSLEEKEKDEVLLVQEIKMECDETNDID